MSFVAYNNSTFGREAHWIEKASPSDVITPGNLVTRDSNGKIRNIVASDITARAGAGGATNLGRAKDGSFEGEESVFVYYSSEGLILEGTADANIPSTLKENDEVDLAIDANGKQVVDVGTSASNVFRFRTSVFDPSVNIVGQTKRILVQINPNQLMFA